MNMALCWFGSAFDTETLKQIPNVKGVMTLLYDIASGQESPLDKMQALKGKTFDVHGFCKIGSSKHEKHITDHTTSLESLGKEGIGSVCNNLIPDFRGSFNLYETGPCPEAYDLG